MKYVFVIVIMTYGTYVLYASKILKTEIDGCYVTSNEVISKMSNLSHQQNSKEFRDAEKQLEQIARTCQNNNPVLNHSINKID